MNDATVVEPSVADRRRRAWLGPDSTGPTGPLVNHERRSTRLAPLVSEVVGVNVRSVVFEPWLSVDNALFLGARVRVFLLY